MRQRFFPPAHGGGNLSGKTLPRFPTATLRSPRRYEQSEWPNRMGGFVGIYADPSPNVPPKAMLRRITPSGRECGNNDASLRDTGNGSCCERKAHARQKSRVILHPLRLACL